MKLAIHHASPIPDTYRAARVSSLFNVEGDADFRIEVEADLTARPWQIGLIVGSSGSGTSSRTPLARARPTRVRMTGSCPLIRPTQ